MCDVDHSKDAMIKRMFPYANFYQDCRGLFSKDGDRIDEDVVHFMEEGR